MIDRLIERIEKLENPSVVGLDPRLSYIPAHVKEAAYQQYGKGLKGIGSAIVQFNESIIDAIHDIVPAVKPQIAMYEQYGAEGIDAYIQTVAYAKSKGMLVIGDIKRGDIASTAEAYGAGHLGTVETEEGPLAVYDTDSITLNPYMGFDSVAPFLKICQEAHKGLFILVKTSNPSGGQIQDLMVAGKRLYEVVGDLVNQWGMALMGSKGYSQVGAVVGATYPEEAMALRKVMPYSYFLVPGYGAQGGTAEDLRGCFNRDGLGAIVNSSRGIIAAHLTPENQRRFRPQEFALAAREAALAMKKDLNRIL